MSLYFWSTPENGIQFSLFGYKSGIVSKAVVGMMLHAVAVFDTHSV
jgi:hypothetical protein